MKSMYASRSVSVLNTPAPNAAYVDDSSSQNESLQRKADMVNGAVQRVVQRETGIVQKVPLPEQFVYRAPENNDLKYIERCIAFTEYDPNLVSSGFTGCLMMAFKFNQSYTCNNFAGGTITVGTDNQSYIAHVFCSNGADDTKQCLIQAEQDGCITIEALFKPWTDDDGKYVGDYVWGVKFDDFDERIQDLEKDEKKLKKRADKFYSPFIELIKGNTQDKLGEKERCRKDLVRQRDEKRGNLGKRIGFTGSLFFDEKRGWKGNVYTPNVNVDGTEYDVYENIKTDYAVNGREDGKKKLKSFSVEEMNLQTLATKAMAYASVIAQKDVGNHINTIVKTDDESLTDVKKNAKGLDEKIWSCLCNMTAKLGCIQRAMSLVKENSKEHKILKASTINE